MGRPVCGIHEALWIARLHAGSAGALYLHIPFCRRKCAYCDFASWAASPDDALIPSYIEALEDLLGQAAEIGLLGACETAYMGGGTPTLAGEALLHLVRRVRTAAPKLSELTCEANPDSLTDDLLEGLAAAGCTRLSLGVQSLSDDELSELERIHSAAQASDRLVTAVASGIDVSCDLMCATPRQTDESWLETIEAVVRTGVGHVSVYPLQIEGGTPLALRVGDDAPFNDPDIQARRMCLARDRLVQAGYERYEVASHAKPGKACRHNQAYWTAIPYLGLGTQASSMLTREGYERVRAVAPQLPVPPSGARRIRLTCTDGPREIAASEGLSDLHFDIEMLDEAQACAEDLMLSMRMVAGVSPGLLEHARDVFGPARIDEVLKACESQGLVTRNERSWQPTERGWLLGNELYGSLWGLAPGEVLATNC